MNWSTSVINTIHVNRLLLLLSLIGHDALETASFFRWSMNTWRLTSSVRIGAPDSCRKNQRNNESKILLLTQGTN